MATLNLRIPDDIKAELTEVARIERRSLTATVLIMIDQGLKRAQEDRERRDAP